METKERHGCVSAWLVLMIILNSLTACIYLLAGDWLAKNSQVKIPDNMRILLAVLGIANVIFAIFLFQWKKWAFWGFAATAVGALVINLNIGLGVGQSLFGLLGIAVLYGVLQIKKDDVSAWKNLE